MDLFFVQRHKVNLHSIGHQPLNRATGYSKSCITEKSNAIARVSPIKWLTLLIRLTYHPDLLRCVCIHTHHPSLFSE